MKTCPICERPMMHTRLYGYRCSNPEHAEIVNQIFRDWLEKDVNMTLDRFVGGYPEHEREMVRRVIEPELPGWYRDDSRND